MINRILRPLNYQLKKTGTKEDLQDIFFDRNFVDIYEQVKNYTMTSPQRLFALYKSVEYVVKYNIPGSFVECGVWRGGSSMVIALTLKKMGMDSREIYMYDTYEGMSEPSVKDNDIYGNDAKRLLGIEKKRKNEANIWCYSTIEDVKQNLRTTGHPEEKLFFIKGKVEETIPGIAPAKIALLRLDTDWYDSTLHEMKHLYPLVSDKGILIIDDYGHWQGARQAIDEYIEHNKLSLFLNRVDYTARLAIKS